MDKASFYQWLCQFSEKDRLRLANYPAIYHLAMTATSVDDLNRAAIAFLISAVDLAHQIALDKEQKTFPVFVNGHGMVFYKPEWMPDGLVEDGFRRWKERKKAAAEGN